MLRNLDGRYPHMPGDMVDRNRNGAIDPDEIDIPTNASPGICGMGPGFFGSIDRNKDGLVPPAELQADIRPPDIVYSERMRITLGGRTVELIHPGLNHSDDATVMHFRGRARGVRHRVPRRRAGHHATRARCPAPAARSTGIRCRSGSVPTGRSKRSTSTAWRPVTATCSTRPSSPRRASISSTWSREVSAGIRSGRPLEELVKTITLDRYKGWANYERLRRMNVEAAYFNLTRYR